ncbi:dienelactone hydrolase family protein [Novosphingobium sediminicola]|uniref:Carboxymethylenebutenolidase n=1 Tax=Novosphingobium sediminicola TaxID=563162 RepID=A0A7W6CGP4_9SPHN|nr:dienelactone hydrolase family protein [Novosphingobium sediminicola]MBB3954349.1 carboxymethylenebutenolidase [Novosphingobium sediminicola]
MAVEQIAVTAAEGTAPAWVYTPEGKGPWPGVILLMDGPGMRPAVHHMAQRLSGHGYVVLLPDLFYRSGAYDPVDPKVVFTDKTLREAHRERFMAPATPKAVMADFPAFLAVLDGRADVAPGGYGVTGYCMGGRLALIAAGTYPDRIAAVASFHGGGLANDTPTSPHLLAGRIRAKIYVAGAIEDANFDDAQKARLIAALDQAGADFTVETYPARHGWVPEDMPVHNPEQAERHWQTLIPFFDGVLK